MYCSHATTGRSQLVAAPLRFQAKNRFFVLFMWQFDGQKCNFWIVAAACSGAATVVINSIIVCIGLGLQICWVFEWLKIEQIERIPRIQKTH